jgi:hypothetical protein
MIVLLGDLIFWFFSICMRLTSTFFRKSLQWLHWICLNCKFMQRFIHCFCLIVKIYCLYFILFCLNSIVILILMVSIRLNCKLLILLGNFDLLLKHLRCLNSKRLGLDLNKFFFARSLNKLIFSFRSYLYFAVFYNYKQIWTWLCYGYGWQI